MTAEPAALEEILGPEPTIEEPVAEEPQVVEEQQEEKPAEVSIEERLKALESERDSYKNAMHSERMERKQYQEQVRLVNERFQKLMEAQTPPPPQIPEYEEDPLGSTYGKVNQLAEHVNELRQAELSRQEQAAFTSYVESVRADEEAFAAKTPDYKDAITFAQTSRVKQLEAMGYEPKDALIILAQEAMQLSQRAQQMGRSPAEFAYNYAKSVGYSPKPPSNIETVAAGQAVAKSVAGGGKPVAEGGIPANLAELSDEEFEALMKKYK